MCVCVCLCLFRKQKRNWQNQRSTKRLGTYWTRWSLKDDFSCVSVLTVRFHLLKCPFLSSEALFGSRGGKLNPFKASALDVIISYCLLVTCHRTCSSCVLKPDKSDKNRFLLQRRSFFFICCTNTSNLMSVFCTIDHKFEWSRNTVLWLIWSFLCLMSWISFGFNVNRVNTKNLPSPKYGHF